MADPKARLVSGWLLKANHDIASAERLIQPDPIPDTAVFHCQQAAEKALKGFLAYHDQPIQKTHDLNILLNQGILFDKRMQTIQDACEVLTPYATAFRYPGNEPMPTLEEAKSLIGLAKGIVALVEKILNKQY